MGLSPNEMLAIPKGSLVLVTGVKGFIANHVVKQLLENEYKVRGTVRSKERSSWLIEYFNSRYGYGSVELVEVPDMAVDGAFDQAVQGCAGMIHTATPVMKEIDPNVAIPTVIAGATNAIKAAAQAGVKRFVLTSSSTAAASPQPNRVFKIDSSVWNTSAVEAAWAPPPHEGVQRKLDVYSASKTQGEQAAWEFMNKEKPDLVLNCILPNMNIGEILSIEHQGYPSTMAWIKALWGGFIGEGEKDFADNPPQYYVNVGNNAMVHVAALIFEDVKSERLFTFTYPYSWNDMLAIFRKLYPDKTFMADIPGLGEDNCIVANARAKALLTRMKRSGWTSLEDSVRFLTDRLTEK
jgi:nucleoside-diphosphate-sugar epimerase